MIATVGDDLLVSGAGAIDESLDVGTTLAVSNGIQGASISVSGAGIFNSGVFSNTLLVGTNGVTLAPNAGLFIEYYGFVTNTDGAVRVTFPSVFAASPVVAHAWPTDGLYTNSQPHILMTNLAATTSVSHVDILSDGTLKVQGYYFKGLK